MLSLLWIVVGIIVVVAITAVTGYFVAQEFAYMAVDRSRLKASAEAGDAAARGLIEAGATAAERKLELFHGPWGGSVDPVFREFAY